MKYFKNIENGYIVSVSTAHGQIEITKEEYDTILSMIKATPQAPQGFEYRIKDDLSWELYFLPIEEEISEENIEN